LNEGHSGFAVFEAIRDRMLEEELISTRRQALWRGKCASRAYAVPAGHDRFNADLIEEHLDACGMNWTFAGSADELRSRASRHHHEQFCMTVLGLKLSRRANAVSSLHGEVSRAMWKVLYPGRSEEAVPIGISRMACTAELACAADVSAIRRHLGVGWQSSSGSAKTWEESRR